MFPCVPAVLLRKKVFGKSQISLVIDGAERNERLINISIHNFFYFKSIVVLSMDNIRKRLVGSLQSGRDAKDTVEVRPRYSTLTVFFTDDVVKETTSLSTDNDSTTERSEHGNAKELYVLVCRRGVGGTDYGKIYSCGGAIDRGETPEEAACREAEEESGVEVSPDQLRRFPTNHPKMAHFYTILDGRPEIHGATPRHAWEVLYERHIIGYPTTKSWAAIPVHELADHFRHNTDSSSAFSELFMKMYDSFISGSYEKRPKSD